MIVIPGSGRDEVDGEEEERKEREGRVEMAACHIVGTCTFLSGPQHDSERLSMMIPL